MMRWCGPTPTSPSCEVGCLIGPLAAGAGSQWVSGHALPLLMAAGAFGLVLLLLRQGAFGGRRSRFDLWPLWAGVHSSRSRPRMSLNQALKRRHPFPGSRVRVCSLPSSSVTQTS